MNESLSLVAHVGSLVMSTAEGVSIEDCRPMALID